ncbi:hypothetical protein FHG87_001543 [Trinorchestia longiramus]|nr:hypothetical protein FHG87_001543 [Trinorchestia longiramus]
MDVPKKNFNPSYQIKSQKRITSKHPKGKAAFAGRLNTPAKQKPVMRSSQEAFTSTRYNNAFSGESEILKEEIQKDVKQTPCSSMIGRVSNYQVTSNPLDLAFDADQELALSIENYISHQDEALSQLNLRIEKLELVHGSVGSAAELKKLQQEATDLRVALTEAEAAIYGERRLVSALHHDNTTLKLQLLQTSQRLASVQLITGISDERIIAFQGSEVVRQKMPDKLRQLQQQLWSSADVDTSTGSVSPEQVLVLQKELQSLQASMALCEKEWAEEKSCLIEEKELRERDREMDDARLKAWVRKAEERLAECQRECRAAGAQCASLTKELQLQQRQHLKEKTSLLKALAKIGGPERLKTELESLDISSSCLDAAVGHANATCQARELKLLSMQLQRELTESENVLAATQRRCDGLEREASYLREARQQVIAKLKKQQRSASAMQDTVEERHHKELQRLRAQIQGIGADMNNVQADLKRLVLMLYKLTMWQSDSCAPNTAPPSPPSWIEGPRAVASLARTLQAAIDAARGRLAGVRKLAAEAV